jgi:hypothetical protein
VDSTLLGNKQPGEGDASLVGAMPRAVLGVAFGE